MTSDPRSRRYLLGDASDEERTDIEREYFRSEEYLDRMADAEDELVEEYLEDRLSPDEREQFESEYLASPVHRTRVETIRRLSQRAQASSRQVKAANRWARPQWLGLAAAAALLIVAGISMLDRRDAPVSVAKAPAPVPGPALEQRPLTPRASAEPAAPLIPAPSIFAVTLSPLAVRGAGERARVVIPPGTDLVDLRLEGESSVPPLRDATVVITTVSGDEVWRGAATTTDRQVGAAVLARARVPAATLRAGDYIVQLRGTNEAATAREYGRYFLRVRAR